MIADVQFVSKQRDSKKRSSRKILNQMIKTSIIKPNPKQSPPFPNERYSIIISDPPWLYDNRKDCNPAMGGFSYPPMPLDAICKLPVKSICSDPCALFLWVTAPKCAEGAHVKVAEAWGFQLVTLAFAWVKTNKGDESTLFLQATQDKGGSIYSGLGSWVNGNVELCFLGWNSRKRLPRLSKTVKQIVFAPVGRHSAKPPVVRDRIFNLLGDVPRIELFARDKVAGWQAWGLDAL